MGLNVAAFTLSGDGTFQNLVQTDRQLLEMLVGGRPGVLDPNDFSFAPTSSMQIIAGSGQCVVRRRQAIDQGFYMVWSDASETLAWPAAHSSLPRIDTLLLRVADKQYGALSSGQDGARWQIIQGTPNAAPVAVSDASIASTYPLVGGWERAFDVLIPAGATSIIAGNITRKLPTTAAAGGIRPTRSALDLADAGRWTGEYRDNHLTKLPERWDGSFWKTPFALGQIANAEVGGSGQFSTTQVGIYALNALFKAGRTYRFLVSSEWVADTSMVNAAVVQSCFVGGTGMSTLTGTGDRALPMSAGSGALMHFMTAVCNYDCAGYFQWNARTSSGTAHMVNANCSIEDIGPA